MNSTSSLLGTGFNGDSEAILAFGNGLFYGDTDRLDTPVTEENTSTWHIRSGRERGIINTNYKIGRLPPFQGGLVIAVSTDYMCLVLVLSFIYAVFLS